MSSPEVSPSSRALQATGRAINAGKGWSRAWASSSVIVLTSAACLGLPTLGVLWTLANLLSNQHEPSPAPATLASPFAWSSIVTTLWVCPAIALLATLLGIPASWALRRASPGWIALVCVPLMLPSFLAYSGWGVLRGPGSALGDWLSRGDPSRVLIADKVFAIGGLALWAWPIATLVMWSATRRLPQSVLDALAMEPASIVRRAREGLALVWPAVLGSVALVTFVMLGSAIPLHLAQIPTYAIHLWAYLSLTPEPIRVWIAAWPLLILALVLAWWVARRARAPRSPQEDLGDPRSRRRSRALVGMAATVWSLSVIVPLMLLAWSLRTPWASLTGFWRESGRAVGQSTLNASMVAGACVLLCLASWRCASAAREHRSVGAIPRAATLTTRCAIIALLAGAFMPGVLVGSATLTYWNLPIIPRAWSDTNLPLLLAHLARFAFVPVLVGLWLGAMESPEALDARRLYAPGARGWWRVRVQGNPAPLIGSGLAVFALSLHEIESSVFLVPPGSANLAQRVLDLLHYARDEQLAAASINLVGLSTLLAGLSAWMMTRGLNEPSSEAFSRARYLR